MSRLVYVCIVLSFVFLRRCVGGGGCVNTEYGLC